MTAGPSPEYRAAIERVEQAQRLEAFKPELAAKVREILAEERMTPRQRRLASLQAEVSARYPNEAERILALSDPRPGTPEATLLTLTLSKPE